MYLLLRGLLFRIDPETAHSLTLTLLRAAGSLAPVRALLRAAFRAESRPVEAFGLRFPNPVGLAAGYDKDGLAWRGLACLGFGHLELGTVTPRAQPGNPRPRLFRVPEAGALINSLGFPSRGAAFLANRLRGHRPPDLVLGVNLGINRTTPLESAHDDYAALLERFAPLADYLVVNVSSPNTLGLRRLQAREALQELLTTLEADRRGQAEALGRPVPLLVKLSPDLSEAELNDALSVILETGMDGVIATNTTLGREGVSGPVAERPGGLSGAPLRARSTQVVDWLHRRSGGELPIVACGGVMGPSDAREKLAAGARLVQVYTGLVYRGPGLVGEIIRAL